MPITTAPASFRSKKGGSITPSRPRAHRYRGLRRFILTKDKVPIAQEARELQKKGGPQREPPSSSATPENLED
ncbi:MAG: hypothetical protein ACJ8E0_05655, partial [Sphingomicrobium sp.]